jgi:Rad3-related DNA helicases
VLKPVWSRRWGANWIGGVADRVLAMSATLISGDQVAHDLGLDVDGTVATVSIDTSFPPENRPVYLAPVADMRAGKTGASREAVGRMARAIRTIMRRSPGERVLVHTHSYRQNEALYGELRAEPRVLTYRSAQGRDLTLAAFMERPGAVLLAPSLERGVSLDDDLCRVQVITKVPFPNKGDKVVAARLYGSGATGRRWYMAETVRSIVQASGRAVRHQDDWAECWILDSAFGDLWRRERALFPRWWQRAVRTDVNVKALVGGTDGVSGADGVGGIGGKERAAG